MVIVSVWGVYVSGVHRYDELIRKIGLPAVDLNTNSPQGLFIVTDEIAFEKALRLKNSFNLNSSL